MVHHFPIDDPRSAFRGRAGRATLHERSLLAPRRWIPSLRRLAAWGLIALFIAVLPANINQALHNLQPPGLEMSPTMVWVRLPLQLVLIAWAYWMTRPDHDTARRGA